MTLFGFLLLLLVAGICGAVGQAIVGWSRGGCVASIGVGLVGAVIGLVLARSLPLPELLPVTIDGTTIPIVWTILGSALFVAVISVLFGARRHSPPGVV